MTRPHQKRRWDKSRLNVLQTFPLNPLSGQLPPMIILALPQAQQQRAPQAPTMVPRTPMLTTKSRHQHRLSEIIDPRDLVQDELYLLTPTSHRSSSQAIPFTFRGLVQSPSGNELGAEEFIMHPSRPLAMWERQERVLQATREGMERFEMESRIGSYSHWGTREGPTPQRKLRRRWWRCGCLC